MNGTPGPGNTGGLRRRPGPTYGDVGIVLRSYRAGESDRLLRILTREHGKRSAVAKGLRRTGSRFGARLEPLSRVRLLMHSGRSLDTVRQAETECSFHEVREDLELFMYGSAMAELVDSTLPEQEPHPEVFDLMASALVLLREHPRRAAFLLAFFDFKMLSIAGYELHVLSCSECGGALEDGGSCFSTSLGGLVCGICRGGVAGAGKMIRVGSDTAFLLGWMAEHDLGEWPEAPPPLGPQRETGFLMDRVVEYWTERESRSQRVMRAVPRRSAHGVERGQADGGRKA